MGIIRENIFGQKRLDFMFRLACSILGRQDEAQDMMQDVAERILRRQDSMDDVGNIDAFITRSVRNACILAAVLVIGAGVCNFLVFRWESTALLVLYLILNIFVSITLPIFIFICRNQDLGMPPKKAEEPVAPVEPEPAWLPQPEEPWNNE